MELTFSYFWLLKLLFSGAMLFSAWKAFNIQSMFKEDKYTWKLNKVWAFIFFIFLLIGVFNPIRMDMQTDESQRQVNSFVKSSKELPPKQEDNSFKHKASTPKSITEEDLK